MSVAFAIAQAAIPIPERWKPMAAFFASCFLAVAITGWIIAHSRDIQRIRHGPNGTKVLTITIIAVIGAGVFVTLWLFFGVPPVADLKSSIIRYRYSSETQELVADVHFVNSGTTRRTVLGVTFTYRIDKETHLIISSSEEFHGGGQPPLYIEPNQPILVTYRHKLTDETLTSKLGVVFGLQISTLRIDGGMNYTSIEAMAVTGFPGDPKVRGLFTTGQKSMPLDVAEGNFPMEVPTVPTTPSPSAMPMDIPSPTAPTAPSSPPSQHALPERLSLANKQRLTRLLKSIRPPAGSRTTIGFLYDSTRIESKECAKDLYEAFGAAQLNPEFLGTETAIAEDFNGVNIVATPVYKDMAAAFLAALKDSGVDARTSPIGDPALNDSRGVIIKVGTMPLL